MEEPSFYAIIPATVRYDKTLPANAKLLYGEITALCQKHGYCFASNKYFADNYDVTADTASVWINLLIKKGYIRSELIYKEGKKEIEQRRLYLLDAAPIPKKQDTPPENSRYPIAKNREDNNTSLKIEREARRTQTKYGTPAIPATQSANDLIEAYVAPIRDYYGGSLADEFRWGNACVKAIEAGIASDRLLAALATLMSQNRTYQITPENVLQQALEDRIKKNIVKPTTGITDEQRRQLQQIQESYYGR